MLDERKFIGLDRTKYCKSEIRPALGKCAQSEN